jgi:hypothetical protein
MSRSETPTDQKTPEEIVRDLEMAWNAFHNTLSPPGSAD